MDGKCAARPKGFLSLEKRDVVRAAAPQTMSAGTPPRCRFALASYDLERIAPPPLGLKSLCEKNLGESILPIGKAFWPISGWFAGGLMWCPGALLVVALRRGSGGRGGHRRSGRSGGLSGRDRLAGRGRHGRQSSTTACDLRRRYIQYIPKDPNQ